MASEEDMALFGDQCRAELKEWREKVPAEAQAKAEARPEAEQMEELEATFKCADTDNDGFLNLAEF